MGNDADKISEMFLFYLKGKGSGFLVDSHPITAGYTINFREKRIRKNGLWGWSPVCALG